MMTADRSEVTRRVKAATGAVAVQVLLGYALLTGLAVSMPTRLREALTLIAIAPPPPPPPPIERARPRPSPRPEGAASPPNLRSRATEVVAPRPIPPITPTPIVAAAKPGTGSDPSAGNADIPGPGTGSGGQGEGTGSGGAGSGGGGGGGTDLVWLRGRIRDTDYPRAAIEAGASGTVYLRFVVGADGRVTRCTVTRSSGNAALDQTTCRLIMERFRYRPSRDAQGRPYPDVVTGEHVWTLREGTEEDER